MIKLLTYKEEFHSRNKFYCKKLLTKKDKKNTKKINDALTKVEKMGADKKKKLPSFGALLKAGKLPSVVKK